jgi:hypothetical protein
VIFVRDKIMLAADDATFAVRVYVVPEVTGAFKSAEAVLYPAPEVPPET